MKIHAVIDSYGIEYAMRYVELGIQIPLVGAVVTYICIMELISIMENMCAVNPELSALFKPYLEKLKGDEENEESKR